MSWLMMFYSTQSIHKQLIQQSYDDCMRIVYKKDKLNDKESEEYKDLSTKLGKCKKILFQNLLTYSRNYPEEKISQHEFIKSYKEAPWRLEQHVEHVLRELYE